MLDTRNIQLLVLRYIHSMMWEVMPCYNGNGVKKVLTTCPARRDRSIPGQFPRLILSESLNPLAMVTVCSIRLSSESLNLSYLLKKAMNFLLST